eukprot:gene3167-biopygen4428
MPGRDHMPEAHVRVSDWGGQKRPAPVLGDDIGHHVYDGVLLPGLRERHPVDVREGEPRLAVHQVDRRRLVRVLLHLAVPPMRHRLGAMVLEVERLLRPLRPRQALVHLRHPVGGGTPKEQHGCRAQHRAESASGSKSVRACRAMRPDHRSLLFIRPFQDRPD